ncbi:hypothetical protein VTJ83DRAFT_70 [Remersonia thermophila]|uniref:MYND-type domain-containing protein n=1 Tax=Remersonia thermophila TaxID=72144 RepID=A0ABR4DK14_9PEZI
MANSCTACSKAPPEVTLKRCAKCSIAPYCSRECQKADWKSHKKTCGKATDGIENNATKRTDVSPPKGLDQPITMPFTRLDRGDWLHDRPEKDVYRALVDAYRLRVADCVKSPGPDQALVGSGLEGFRHFLRLTSEKGLLPDWWNEEKQRECEELATRWSEWQCVNKTVDEADIAAHYGEKRFSMQLRMFAEAVYGTIPGGFGTGHSMRQMMVAMEQGSLGGAA